MNIKGARQFVYDKNIRSNAVPEDLRNKVTEVLTKNASRRGRAYSTLSMMEGGNHRSIMNMINAGEVSDYMPNFIDKDSQKFLTAKNSQPHIGKIQTGSYPTEYDEQQQKFANARSKSTMEMGPSGQDNLHKKNLYSKTITFDIPE